MGFPGLAIFVAVLVLALLLAFIWYHMKLKKKPKTDYYAFYIMGIIWMIVGAIAMVFRTETLEWFFFMGLIFALIGMGHKGKWKDNRTEWKELTPDEKKIRVVLLSVGSILLVVGIIVFYYLR